MDKLLQGAGELRALENVNTIFFMGDNANGGLEVPSLLHFPIKEIDSKKSAQRMG